MPKFPERLNESSLSWVQSLSQLVKIWCSGKKKQQNQYHMDKLADLKWLSRYSIILTVEWKLLSPWFKIPRWLTEYCGKRSICIKMTLLSF